MNLLQVAKVFATEDMALAYWIMTRWPEGVRCLACDNAKVYAITTKGKTGKIARLFECAECGLHFSATTGTLFHDSHLPLTKWFAAIALMCESKKGISANQVRLGVIFIHGQEGDQFPKTDRAFCHLDVRRMLAAAAFSRSLRLEGFLRQRSHAITMLSGRSILDQRGRIRTAVRRCNRTNVNSRKSRVVGPGSVFPSYPQ